MGDYSFESIANFLRQIFVGTLVIDDGTITYGSDAVEVLADTLLVAPVYEHPAQNVPMVTSEDAAAMAIFLEGLATSITNTLRTGAWSTPITGTSYNLATFVNVQWLWTIPPIIFVILTLVFLIATMTKSKRESTKLWKTSGLATMYSLSHGLEAVSVMEGKAEKVFVELKKEGQGWRLVESK